MSSLHYDQSRKCFMVNGIVIPSLTYELVREYPELRRVTSPVGLVRFCQRSLVEQHGEFIHRRFGNVR